MTEDERKLLLARMQATLAEAKKMTPEQARERLEAEERAVSNSIAGGSR